MSAWASRSRLPQPRPDLSQRSSDNSAFFPVDLRPVTVRLRIARITRTSFTSWVFSASREHEARLTLSDFEAVSGGGDRLSRPSCLALSRRRSELKWRGLPWPGPRDLSASWTWTPGSQDGLCARIPGSLESGERCRHAL